MTTTSAPAPIRVYNTLSKTKEPLVPVQPGKIGIYLCGPTVYKPSHIGHMVGPVIFDAIKRYLRYSGYQVTWVVNVTDVDDKLIAESKVRGLTMAQLAEEMTADYRKNLDAMGVDTIDHFPKATENIDEIIKLTQALIDKGFAYASDGDVYFDVLKDSEYGKLSNRSVESMQGEGGSTAERKRSAADFALWKSAKPGEPSWPSPWGPGRPGWHIECSAMSRRLLGETFDIHGGGLDLVFPHHENEIAQSECCHGKPQAKYWLHNGLMQAADEVGKVGGRATREAAAGDFDSQSAGKISKSKGAGPFRDLLQEVQAEAIRFFLLATHYRSPIYFSLEELRKNEAHLEKFQQFFRRYERVTGESFYQLAAAENRSQGAFDSGSDATLKEIQTLRERFLNSMDDDFNSGGAVGVLFELLRLLNRFVESEKLEESGKTNAAALAVLKQGARTLRELTGVLGLFRKPIEQKTGADESLVQGLMKLLLEIRSEVRQKKDFATSDKIRNALAALGVVVEDRKEGATWSLTKS
ncbi:MAG TPA: cysteine--tRNA ligase [Pirellulales bacterium]|jgi:cysteinyl-tRNA synthetase|nr:cysteine--tRNA ligase [Pirellulales bacterium]